MPLQQFSFDLRCLFCQLKNNSFSKMPNRGQELEKAAITDAQNSPYLWTGASYHTEKKKQNP